MRRNQEADDIVQYSFRLNLSKERHLKLHQVLKDVNRKVYNSKNEYIVETLLNNAPIVEIEQSEYVTKKELEKWEQDMKYMIMQEMTRVFCGIALDKSQYSMEQSETLKRITKRMGEDEITVKGARGATIASGERKQEMEEAVYEDKDIEDIAVAWS